MKFSIKILTIIVLIVLSFSFFWAQAFASEIPAAEAVRQAVDDIYDILWPIGIALAILILIFGGFIWLTSFGSPGRISKAIIWIKASLLGLCILVSADALLALLGVPTLTGKLIGIEIDIQPVEIVVEEDILFEWRCKEIDIQGVLNDFIVLKKQAIEYAYWIDETVYGTTAHNNDFKRKRPERQKLIDLGLKPDLEIKGILPKTKEVVKLAQGCRCEKAMSEVSAEHSLKSPSHCPADKRVCPENLIPEARNLKNQLTRSKDIITLLKLKEEEWGVRGLITKEVENEVVIFEKVEKEIEKILRRKALPQELANDIVSFLKQFLEQRLMPDPLDLITLAQAGQSPFLTQSNPNLIQDFLQKKEKELKKEISLILEAALSTRIALLEQTIKELNKTREKLDDRLRLVEHFRALLREETERKLFNCAEAMVENAKANCQKLNFFLCRQIEIIRI